MESGTKPTLTKRLLHKTKAAASNVLMGGGK